MLYESPCSIYREPIDETHQLGRLPITKSVSMNIGCIFLYCQKQKTASTALKVAVETVSNYLVIFIIII